MKTIQEMVQKVTGATGTLLTLSLVGIKEIEAFAALVREDERKRVTNLLMYMHNKAAAYHNYYKHAAIELNRKASEGEKI